MKLSKPLYLILDGVLFLAIFGVGFGVGVLNTIPDNINVTIDVGPNYMEVLDRVELLANMSNVSIPSPNEKDFEAGIVWYTPEVKET